MCLLSLISRSMVHIRTRGTGFVVCWFSQPGGVCTVYTHTHTHKHTQIHIHTHTTHTHIHTHTHTIISFPITCTFSQGALTQRSSSSGEPPPSSSNTINSMPLISPNYFEYFSFPLIWSCEVLAGEGCSKLG